LTNIPTANRSYYKTASGYPLRIDVVPGGAVRVGSGFTMATLNSTIGALDGTLATIDWVLSLPQPPSYLLTSYQAKIQNHTWALAPLTSFNWQEYADALDQLNYVTMYSRFFSYFQGLYPRIELSSTASSI
jgi:hypothetical protein